MQLTRWIRTDQYEYIDLLDVKDEPDFDGSNTDKRKWMLIKREKMA